jgi:hypothetical protein
MEFRQGHADLRGYDRGAGGCRVLRPASGGRSALPALLLVVRDWSEHLLDDGQLDSLQ